MSTRILYVDDEPDIREIAVLALGLDPDFEVRSCESGPEAIEAVGQWRPDVMLLDVMMPGMDGPTTLARLRETEAGARLPVLFITALPPTKELERFLALGAAGVIAKPFDPIKLAGTVSGHMQRLGAAGETEFDAHFAMVRERFRTRLTGRLEALRAASCERAASPADKDVLGTIKRLAHDLAGASGTFGFPELGEIASRLEGVAIRALLSPEEAQGITPALDALTTALETTIAERRAA